FSRMNSTDPSVEPLSETMTSNSVECVSAQMERRHSLIVSRSFQQTVTMDNFIAKVSRTGRLCQFSGSRGSVAHPHGSQFRMGTAPRFTILYNHWVQ